MKKKLKSMKGFAMAELLAVSMVVLLIFSILFSNYLPLVAEYENRLNYNNTSAQFAAYYARKIYNGVMENGNKFTTTIGDKINSDKYYVAYNYKKSNSRICNSDVTQLKSENKNEIFGVNDDKDVITRCQNIFNEYGVEEIILTKYKLTDVKDGYTQNDGTLYNYIKYLPEYKNTVYQDNNELYRIIIKTKDGYATTPIVADYYTPGSCFTTKKGDDDSLTVTGYNQDNGDCGANVVFTDKQIKTIGGGLGVITAIGEGAFKNTSVISIDFDKGKLNSIGEGAFNGVKSFKGSSTEEFDLSGIKNIGKNAFNGTSLVEVNIPLDVTIGSGAFSNIKTLNGIVKIGKNNYNVERLFENSGSSSGIRFPSNVSSDAAPNKIGNSTFKSVNLLSFAFGVVANIDDNAFESATFMGKSLLLPEIKTIGNASFKNVEFDNIQFGTKLTTIGKDAFKMDDSKNSVLTLLNIPSSVTSIGESAFENRKIANLSFSSESKLNSISKSVFAGCGITDSVTIPSTVKTIDASAFANNGFSSVILSSELISIGESVFKNNSNLTSINIPSKVNSIGDSAFAGCSNISSINVQSSVYKGSEKNWCNAFGYKSGCVVEPNEQDNTTWYLKADGQSVSIVYGGATNEQ